MIFPLLPHFLLMVLLGSNCCLGVIEEAAVHPTSSSVRV